MKRSPVIRAGRRRPARAARRKNERLFLEQPAAKWLAAECDILVVDEPPVGIDVRTKAAVHELIAGPAADGLALLLISSDLPVSAA